MYLEVVAGARGLNECVYKRQPCSTSLVEDGEKEFKYLFSKIHNPRIMSPTRYCLSHPAKV